MNRFHLMMNDQQKSPPVKARRGLDWLREIQDMQWRWVLLPGTAVSLINVLFIGVLVSFYAAYLSVVSDGGMPDTDAIGRFAVIAGTVGSPITQVLLTGGVASWVVRRVGTAVSWYGLLIGVTSGFGAFVQALVFADDPAFFLSWQVITFFPLPMLAGWIGARQGRTGFAGQERLFRTSQAVRHAHSPQAIVQAIGDNLANPQVVLVALWEVLLQGEGERPTAVSLLAAWSAGAESDWQPGLQLTTAETGILLQLQPDSPLLVKIADLPADQSALWAAPGTKSVLFLPLLAASGHWAGILTIGSRAAGGFSRTEEHNYVTMGAQIALVLDNMRLVQKAQETAVLQERQRLAREIHDTLAQGFTSIVMHLEAAEQAMAHDAGTLQRHLNQARQTARDSLAQARRVVQDLRPEPLEAAALPDAIQQVAGKWEKQSGVKTAVAVTGDAFPLPPDAEVTLLRTAQEALANIRKHAAADDVRITLSYMADMVILDVQDNGVGLENTDKSPGERNGGYGLTAMRERVAQLNGTVLLESEPEEGTTLVVTIPVGGER